MNRVFQVKGKNGWVTTDRYTDIDRRACDLLVATNQPSQIMLTFDGQVLEYRMLLK